MAPWRYIEVSRAPETRTADPTRRCRGTLYPLIPLLTTPAKVKESNESVLTVTSQVSLVTMR